MFILGLTGPTGAGKSLAARHLEQRGFSHIDADKASRIVVEPGKPCINKLAEAFGPDIVRQDGSLDRKKLAELAFSRGRVRVAQLNAITHPFIIEEIERQLKALEDSGVRFAVLDAPALLESGGDRFCNSIMVIIAARQKRLERIMQRDGISLEQALDRLKAQPDDEFYISHADFVIENNKYENELIEKLDSAADKIIGC